MLSRQAAVSQDIDGPSPLDLHDCVYGDHPYTLWYHNSRFATTARHLARREQRAHFQCSWPERKRPCASWGEAKGHILQVEETG